MKRLSNAMRDKVLADIAAETGVRPDQILSLDRRRYVAHTRQLAMWRLREIGSYSLPEIGRAFARDHATVLFACRQVERRLVHSSAPAVHNAEDANHESVST